MFKSASRRREAKRIATYLAGGVLFGAFISHPTGSEVLGEWIPAFGSTVFFLIIPLALVLTVLAIVVAAPIYWLLRATGSLERGGRTDSPSSNGHEHG